MAAPAPQDCIPVDQIQRLQAFVGRIGELNNRISGERTANEQFRDAIRVKIQALTAKIAEITPRMQQLTEAADAARQQIEALTGERDDCRRQLVVAQAALQGAQNERDAALAQVAQLTQQVADAQGQNQQIQQQLQDAQQQLDACNANAARCQQQIAELLQAITDIDNAINTNNGTIDELHNTAGATYQEIQDALNQLQQDLDGALPPAGVPVVPPAPPGGGEGPGGRGAGPLIPPEDEEEGAGGGAGTPGNFYTPREEPIVSADTMIQLGPKQMTLGQAIAQLSAKNNQIKGRDPNNKYAEVLNKVRAAQTVDEANAALSNAGLGYNQQGELKGGKTKKQRKTRKGKKGKKSRKGKKAKKSQRGGYRAVYKNTRRRSTRKTSSA
jgi:predicted  nucleic acid-binding Zn-ribbon protein